MLCIWKVNYSMLVVGLYRVSYYVPTYYNHVFRYMFSTQFFQFYVKVRTMTRDNFFWHINFNVFTFSFDVCIWKWNSIIPDFLVK